MDKDKSPEDQIREQCAQHAETLSRSFRGRQAMRELKGLLQGNWSSLDGGNKWAVLFLLTQAFGSFPGTVLYELERQIGEGDDE